MPPNSAAWRIVRDRDCVPPAHVSVQSDHFDQSESAQSIGHAAELHARLSRSAGQSVPPWSLAVSTERVRFCEPPPHERVHADQSPNEETAQCTGQWLLLQGMCSLAARQATPP